MTAEGTRRGPCRADHVCRGERTGAGMPSAHRGGVDRRLGPAASRVGGVSESAAAPAPEVDDQVADRRPPVSPTAEIPRPPRPGDMSVAWRITTAITWIAVILGLAGVWNASVQLGLGTWWLGPRSSPQPVYLRMLPFVPAVVILLAVINNVRGIAWAGIVGAATVAVVGIVDLGYVRRLAWVELAIAAAALLVSVASFTGIYRRADPPPG
jgi:hypothetical protein